MPAAALVAMYVGEDPARVRALRSAQPGGPAPRWEVAGPGVAGLRAVRQSDPDIVIVDGDVDDHPVLCRDVRAVAPSAVVLLLAGDTPPPPGVDGVISWTLLRNDLPGNVFGALAEVAAVTRAPGDRVTGLTAQEIAVLECAAHGMTADETAPELGLTPGAVRSALRTAKTKLRASSRAHAVAVAIRAGLFPA
ncbi:response regulator transcription factor [Amycolatopsis thermoflava]|uniref:response regulator transcription factor n=1 Tax=Amycolatopsis thermoflava TaxID=84480 RepID=UPI0037F7F82C